jgi:hypothetical protein
MYLIKQDLIQQGAAQQTRVLENATLLGGPLRCGGVGAALSTSRSKGSTDSAASSANGGGELSLTYKLSRAWVGVYLVSCTDPATGLPAYYVGKGDPLRADTSVDERGGTVVAMIGIFFGDEAAYDAEAAVIRALTLAGLTLVNKIAGRGGYVLHPSTVLAAVFTPVDGPRRTLTLDDTGVAVLVPANCVHGSGQHGLTREVYKSWSVHSDLVRKIRALLAAGRPVRLIGVAPANIVVSVDRITSVKTFDRHHEDAGQCYFGLQQDAPAQEAMQGHRSPVARQQGLRYLTPQAASRAAFLAVPLTETPDVPVELAVTYGSGTTARTRTRRRSS